MTRETKARIIPRIHKGLIRHAFFGSQIKNYKPFGTEFWHKMRPKVVRGVKMSSDGRKSRSTRFIVVLRLKKSFDRPIISFYGPHIAEGFPLAAALTMEEKR